MAIVMMMMRNNIKRKNYFRWLFFLSSTLYVTVLWPRRGSGITLKMATVKYECCLSVTIGQSGSAKNRASVVSGRPPSPLLCLVARGWRDGNTNVYTHHWIRNAFLFVFF